MKKLKNFLAVALVAIMALVLMPFLPGVNGVANAAGEAEFYAVFNTAAEGTEGQQGYKPANTLSFYYDANKPETGGTKTVYGSLPTNATGSGDWGYHDQRSNIKNVVIDNSVKNYNGLESTASMFMGCEALTSLDLSNFDTSNVKNMTSMFNGCKGLESLDVSKFVTTNVTTMRQMFDGCEALTSLDVSNFDTSNVTDMGLVFSGCSALTSLDVSDFDTSNVTEMRQMFKDCSKLNNLDVSNFNTTNVTTMASMFYGCSGIESQDVSNFDTTNVMNMAFMFNGCSKLTTIYASDKFVTSGITEVAPSISKNMFDGCTSLEGGAGTKYDSSKTNKEYARIDKGQNNPGYFTGASAPVKYIDAEGATKTCKEYTEVTASNQAVTWNAGWYVVNKDVTISKRITCNGAVHLILVDGAKLTASKGITCTGDNSFTVYGQSLGTGELVAEGESNGAGIGGGSNGNGSNITINGGVVNATGGTQGAGIGGGSKGSGSDITINGGTVNAISGGGAGIGGGNMGSGSDITINGGTVNATGYMGAAGIGGGLQGTGNNISINGGTVTATGSKNGDKIGAGIGNGTSVETPASNIKISTGLAVYADGNNPPKTAIANDGGDIASSLAEKQYVIVKKAVASITSGKTTTNYITVQDAVGAAEANQTVKMIADSTENISVTENMNITLDLNGHVLNGTGNGSVITVEKGNLTIKDSNTEARHYFKVGTDEENNLWKLDTTATEGPSVFELVSRPNAGDIIMVPGGIITGGNVGSSSGGGIKIEKSKNKTNGSLTVYGGSVVGNNGGGIDSSAANGTLFIATVGCAIAGNAAISNSGIIVGNTDAYVGARVFGNTAGGTGGGVCVRADGVNISGDVVGNVAKTNGGGVYFQSSSKYLRTCTISGLVTGNICGSSGNGGGVYLQFVQGEKEITLKVSGKARIYGNLKGTTENNLYLLDSNNRVIASNLESGAKIGVTTETAPTSGKPVAITGSDNADYSQYFTSDNQAYKVKFAPATTDPEVAAHLELANYDLNQIVSNTVSISLEKDDMTAEQATAIAWAQMPITGLSGTTLIAYAKADDFGTSSEYKYLYAFPDLGWSEGGEFTLAQLRAGVANFDIFVIGTTHEHSFTYEADTSKKTITATCSESGCELKDNKVTVTLAAENKEYTGEAYAGASITNKTAWEAEEAADLTLEYVGRAGTGYTKSTTAPTKAGKYTVTMTASEKSVSADFEITKKQLTVNGTTVQSSKVFDGNTTVTVTANGTLSGVIGQDDVSLDTVTAAYADKNAGTAKAVTATYTIKGADKDNYLAPVKNTGLTADITKKSIVDAKVTLKGGALVETGEELTQKVESVTMDGWKLDITYNVTENKATKAGQYELKVTGNGNYEGTVTAPFVVLEAPKPEEEITPISEKITVKPCGENGGKVTLEVQKAEGTPKTAINMSTSDLIGAVASAEDVKKIAQGKNLSIWVEVGTSSKSSDKEAEKAIKELLAGKKVGYYMDITVFKQLEGEDAEQVTNTNKDTALVFSTQVSEELRKTNEKFGIIRYHEEEGKAEVLESAYDEKTGILYFTSDKYSVFALTMTAIPSTGDNSNAWLFVEMALAAMVAITMMGLNLRKREKR